MPVASAGGNRWHLKQGTSDPQDWAEALIPDRASGQLAEANCNSAYRIIR